MARIIADHPGLAGLYQVASAPIAKHDLLVRLRDAYRLSVDIAPDDGFFCDRSMRGDKLRDAIEATVRPSVGRA